ncbi:hypothetical protein B5V89_15520 [Heyndrickxia sporothermodurans]|uniref:hypothetical protein n=1 Tax=Heyndrickxia TaxID=2837504 RepID=UPI000D384FD3|nr:hypothetical protein [Heyndrickxia sporothermodurans]PTY77209.1 hypothetical protein B5V89_15520 [Heyndrickxia sporothermodurans]
MSVNLNVDLSKVVVSFNTYELFLNGYYRIIEKPSEKFDDIEMTNSIFVFRDLWVETDKLSTYNFQCGYRGTGPRNLVNFLDVNTDVDMENLETNVFTYNVIEYDFTEKKLIAYDSKYSSSIPIHVKAKKDGRLVFFLNGMSFGDRTYDKDVLLQNIIEIYECSKVLYDEPSPVKNIKYIGDRDSKEFHYYKLPCFNGRPNDNFNFILEFEDFEMWIDFPFQREQRNILYSDEFKEVLNKLGFILDDSKYDNKIFKAIDRFFKSHNDKIINQTISIS